MSDRITLYCPRCGKLSALKKEYDKLKVKLEWDKEDWYNSSIPVYTCQECGFVCAIEMVYKRKEQLIATPLNSKGSPSENSLNISLKDNSNELSQISSNDETSLNNNIQSNQRGLLQK